MGSDLGKALDPIADKLTQIVMLACLLTRFGNLLFPCVLLIVKEIVTGCMGIAVIRRTGKVLAAEWHGKLTTFLLYTLMIAHVVFYCSCAVGHADNHLHGDDVLFVPAVYDAEYPCA